MATRLDAAQSANATTIAYTVGAGSNRRLIIGITSEGTQAGQHTCTWGDQTATFIAEAIAGTGATQQTVSLFECTESQIAAVSGNTITAGNVPADFSVHARSYQDCEQGTLTNSDTDSTAGTTPNPLDALDITPTDDDAIVAAVTGMGNVGTYTWAGVQEQTDQQTASATGSYADLEQATAATVACEPTSVTQNRAAGVAVAIENSVTAGITGVVPTTFDMDNTNIVVSGSDFESTQGSGTIYISDANTLAGSANEVDVSDAVFFWNDTSVQLVLTQAGEEIINNLQTLGPGQRFIIILTSAPNEYASAAITLHRPQAFEMALGAGVPGTTTSRLTGMSGTFGGGRLEEVAAQNPSTTNTNVAAAGNREDVWSIEAQTRARDVTYDFRVLYGGQVPDTITQTPNITIVPNPVPTKWRHRYTALLAM